MARISEIRIMQTPVCYTVSIRRTINFMEAYVPFFEEALSVIDSYLDEHGVTTSSVPMTCFYNTDLEHLEVAAGYHTAQLLPDAGEISCQSCPSGRVVSAIDMGPYKQQDATMTDMFEYIKQNGLQMLGPIYYYYLNTPARPESQYLTQMIIPIK